MLVNNHEIKSKNAVLLISCNDQKGITSAVTRFIYEHDGNIVHADQHIDDQTNTFFMRIEWSLNDFTLDEEEIARVFQLIADKYAMKWEVRFTDRPARVAIFVSKPLHCLIDLLLRQMAGHKSVEKTLRYLACGWCAAARLDKQSRASETLWRQ